MLPDDSLESLSLSEDAAHRLLARAVELDAARASSISVAQLREAAREAGISPAAFDRALAEVRSATELGGAGVPASGAGRPPTLIRRLWRRMRGEPEPAGSRSVSESVLANGIAFVSFWGVLTLLVELCRATDAGWQLRAAADLVALLLGAGVAQRLRARMATVVLAGFALAEAAEYLMDLIYGVPAVQGAGSHVALFIAAVAGVALGGLLVGRPRDDARISVAHPVLSAEPAERAPASPGPETPDTTHPLLRLRPV